MKIAIFGASGRTGRLLCDQSLARDHGVAAYVRNCESMSGAAETIEIVEGGLSDKDAMRKALDGCDAAILALGTVDRKRNTVLSDGTAAITEAMKAQGISRIAAITSMGCGDSRDQVNSRIMRLIIKTVAKEIWADKDRQEEVIRASGLDYLLVRPGGLLDKPARGTWTELRAGEKAKGKQMIPRADVAAYILDRLEKPPLGDDAVVLF